MEKLLCLLFAVAVAVRGNENSIIDSHSNEKHEIFHENNFTLDNLQRFNSSLDVINILSLLNITSSTSGVRVRINSGAPTYRFKPGFGTVELPHEEDIISALSSPLGFTLIFIYKQHKKSIGTLLSVNSPGRVSPWFQLTSNLRIGQLILHYRVTADSKLHQAVWMLDEPFHVGKNVKKGNNGWISIFLSHNPQSGLFRMYLDCRKIKDINMQRHYNTVFGHSSSLNIPKDALVYFRQEPGFKKKFLGSMQVAKILPFFSHKPTPDACRTVHHVIK